MAHEGDGRTGELVREQVISVLFLCVGAVPLRLGDVVSLSES